MGKIYPHFGNSCAIVALQSSGAMPTNLTLWTGTAGNCIKFSSFVQGKTKAGINVNLTKYKTNDDALYDTKEEKEAVITGNLYDRSTLVASFMETAIPTFKAAGRKFLVIMNLGIVAAKHVEVYQVSDINSQTNEEDNNPDNSMPFEALSTPPSSALALTTTQLAAINTALGSGTVKGAAATKTVPAAPTPRLRAETAVA